MTINPYDLYRVVKMTFSGEDVATAAQQLLKLRPPTEVPSFKSFADLGTFTQQGAELSFTPHDNLQNRLKQLGATAEELAEGTIRTKNSLVQEGFSLPERPVYTYEPPNSDDLTWQYEASKPPLA
jgi:hypothetical protein